jgi:glyoxylase-like metal-dependent hydrolase (beta-lactamase superfamily II)
MNIVNVGYGSANYYVLRDDDARLLVDVGMPGTLPRLLANLRRNDVALETVRHLLATHYHPDHAGIAQELKQRGLRLIVLDVQRSGVATLNDFLKRHGASAGIALHDNVDLRLDGSRAFLATLGVAGEIVATPGHSDDSVTLVLNDGVAFTGDLPPAGFAAEKQAATVAQSWTRLRALGVRHIYPGHGPARPLDD